MRLSLLFNFVLIALALAQSLYYYPQLPRTMASHFGGNGQANDWQSKTEFFAIYWLVILLTTGFFVFTGPLLRRTPDSNINLPHKNYWLAPQRRAESLLYLTKQLEWFAVASLLLVIVIIQMVIVTNLSRSSVLPPAPSWTALGVYCLFTAIWTAKLMRRFANPHH